MPIPGIAGGRRHLLLIGIGGLLLVGGLRRSPLT
jgi:hypothetical protein